MEQNNALTVSEINNLIKTILSESLNMTFYVSGEISGLKPSGGNLFFHLKDETSLISAVFWGGERCRCNNGDYVTVKAKIMPFTKQGTYKLQVMSMDKDGIGDLYSKYENLKNELEQKQYFSKKRDFPLEINRIGILTAIEGAALQDILYVLKNNKFAGEVLIKNSVVQGEKCPKSVKDGIEYFNNLNKQNQIDVLIIARGGGSFEDLMGYSTEEVVKAIYDSDIFTISAIGHEVDTMLSDYASDFRAPTPSVAGETIIKMQKKKFEHLYTFYEKIKRLEHMIHSKIINYENKIDNLISIHKLFNPKNVLDNTIYKYENLLKNLKEKISHRINEYVYEIEKLKNKNNIHDTAKILKSGYIIATNEKGDLIETASSFKKSINEGLKIKLTFCDETIDDLAKFIQKNKN